MYRHHNLSAHAGSAGASSPAKHIMLMHEDLPEVMMERLELKKRGSPGASLHSLNLTEAAASSHSHVVDSSLLASLRATKRDAHEPLLTINLDWLRALFIAFIVCLVLVLSVRFYLWRRRHRRVLGSSLLEAEDDEEHNLVLDIPPSDFMATEDFNTSNTGVSVPLLQEVTRL